MSNIIKNIILKVVTLSVKEKMVKDKTLVIPIDQKESNVTNVKDWGISKLNVMIL